MSLLMHLLAADVRRSTLIVALWVAALITEATVIQASAWQPPFSQTGMTLMLVARLLWFATTLLSWALVPFVLQLHPAVGSRAFWTTRPIPPDVLVAAKFLLLVAVFVGAPLAIEQVIMAFYGMPGADMARVASITALYRGVFLVLLAVPAALTPSLARFALLCGGALFALAMFPLLLMLLEAILRSDDQSLSVSMTGATGVDAPVRWGEPTSQLVGMVLLLAAGLIAVMMQYARRRVRDTVFIVIGGVIVSSIVGSQWPWPLVYAEVTPPAWTAAADALQLEADVSGVRFDAEHSRSGFGERWTVQVPMTMTPATPGWIATARVRRATLRTDRQALSTSTEYAGSAVLPDRNGRLQGTAALQRVLGVGHVLEWGMFNAPKQLWGVAVHLPATVVDAAKGRTGVFEAEFLIDITELDAASVMPLGRGLFQDRGYRFTIVQVREAPSGVEVHGHVARVSTVLDRHVRPVYSYFLRNRRLGQAVRGNSHGGFGAVSFAAGFHFSWGTDQSGFSSDAHTIRFDGRDPMTPDAQMILTPEWLKDAEFVIVRATHEGSVSRTLEIRDLPLRQ